MFFTSSPTKSLTLRFILISDRLASILFLRIFIPDTFLTPYVFSLGALLFASAQLLTPMPNLGITVKRLVWQQRIGALLLLATGVLMFCSRYGVSPFSGAEWQMSLAIAAVLEVYTAFRLPAAIQKAKKQ